MPVIQPNIGAASQEEDQWSTGGFQKKRHVCSLEVSAAAFQQLHGRFVHFNVRDANETRLKKLEYVVRVFIVFPNMLSFYRKIVPAIIIAN